MKNMKTILILIAIALVLVIGVMLTFSLFTQPAEVADRDADSIFSRLFPFGKSDEDSTFKRSTTTDFAYDDSTLPVPKLRQISPFPVAGAITIEGKEDTVIRFIERETGNVFDTTTTSLAQTRISNTTIPRIQDAIWVSGGEALVIRYFDEENENIENFYAELTESDGEEKSLVGSFLKRNIHGLTYSESKDKIFYLEGSSGSVAGTVSDPDGKRAVRILNYPISEWLSQWVSGNIISLTTKPSYLATGYMYFLNSSTESFRKIFSGKDGLTTLVDTDIDFVIYSESLRNGIVFGVKDLNSGEETVLPVKTLPEKCVWSKKESGIVYCAVPNTIESGQYPDIWYQGLISFSDSIWKIDINAGSADIIIDPENENGIRIDAIKLSLTEKEGYLTFINKKDSTLWSLEFINIIEE